MDIEIEMSLLILFAASSVAVTVGVVLWAKKFRDSVSKSFDNMLAERSLEAKHIGEILENLHKRQSTYENHLHKLAESHLQMKHDIISISTRVENNERQMYGLPEQRIIH